MKALTAILFLGLGSFAANNEPQQTTIQTRTTVGQSQIVAVGKCNLPARGYGTISSNFAYTVCQENVTADYEVSGSGWSKNYRLIPGTEKSTFSLVQKENGQSQYVPQEQADIFDFIAVQTACMSILEATSGSVVHISKTRCGQAQ